MCKKIFAVLGILFCITFVFSACSNNTGNVDSSGQAAHSLPTQYDTIIKNIINSFPWNDDASTVVLENPELSYMYCHNEELSDVGFALIDLDNNGQDELIIADANRPYVYDLYTISGGKITHLFGSGERYYYILYENGYIENGWSGSAVTSGHDFYEFSDGKLNFIERITMDAYHASDVGLFDDIADANEDNTFFKSKSDKPEDYIHISSSEALNAIEAHQNKNEKLNIEYTLLSEYK